MRLHIIATTMLCCIALGSTAILAAPPEGKGGGKGGGGGGGGEDPPAQPFVPAIAYFQETRKSKDLRLANRAGDQACLVLQSASGEPKLRGFAYHAASNKLAYSTDGLGIRIATWGSDPCSVTSGPVIPQTGNPEFMHFSPDGSLLAWSEGDPDYTGFGSAYIIVIYDLSSGARTEFDLKQWGGTRPEWGVDGEWSAGNVHFSPDFDSSNEIVFSGGPLDGSQGAYNSLFVFNLDGSSAPQKFYDGAGGMDSIMSVTRPSGAGVARMAISQGEIRQIVIDDGSQGPSFDGTEPSYSCDNSEIIHRFATGKWNKYEIRITSSDGSSTETWSKANLRFFDWFCAG